MAFLAIASDLSGNVFSVDHNGDLHHNRHAQDDGTGPLIHPGLGERIAGGWGGIQHLAATRFGGRTRVVGVRFDGRVLSTRWPADAQSPLAAALDAPMWPGLRGLFGGSRGELYGVTTAGALVSRRFAAVIDPLASDVLPASPGVPIAPSGWGNRLAVFSNGERAYFDVTVAGDLRYQTTAADGDDPSQFTADGWLTLASAWLKYQRAFAAGPRAIYTISSEGTLERRRFTVADDGAVQLALSTDDDVVAHGIVSWEGLPADVEGYCWPQSASPGDTIEFRVATRLSTGAAIESPNYRVDFRRLRRMLKRVERDLESDEIKESRSDFTAKKGTLPADWLTNGVGWQKGFSLSIPDLTPDDKKYWRPGLYAARCTDTGERDFYIPFVVRPKATRNPFAVIANTNTWNAYNSWGGHGKYVHTATPPETIPFLRPHPGLTPDVLATGEAFNQTRHLLRAELWLLGYLEDLGPAYAYDMFSDQDLDGGIVGIGDGAAERYKGLILNTHPEYWTRAMYNRLKAYQDQGGNILYLGGNGVYEEVALENGGKRLAVFPGVDRSTFPAGAGNEQLRMSCLLRKRGFPERKLLGIAYEKSAFKGNQDRAFELVASAGKDPGLRAALLKDVKGTSLGADGLNGPASGWENDRTDRTFPRASPDPSDPFDILPNNPKAPQTPDRAERLAASHPTHHELGSELVFFRTDQNGFVLSAGALNFTGSLAEDVQLQKLVQNALDLCLNGLPPA